MHNETEGTSTGAPFERSRARVQADRKEIKMEGKKLSAGASLDPQSPNQNEFCKSVRLDAGTA